MEVLHERCAGVDVHKKEVVVCSKVRNAAGQVEMQKRRFATMTADVLGMLDWLKGLGVTHVVMESTGVYWKPIYNILESEFEVLVVNAQHIKYVPGRKSDMNDAQWLAELLQHGLLKASYIPEAPQRALRELIRYRTHLIQERSREANRIHKVLEDANLKLGVVASDVLGVSGRDMLNQIIQGETDPTVLAQLARGRLREKIADLERALTGQVRDEHRLLLRLHLEHIDELNQKVTQLGQEIERLLLPFDTTQAVERLDSIPGIDRRVAEIIVAELGVDMSRFPSAGHAASWAGLTPGKNESAGKNRSSRTRPGNKYLKAALVEAAHAAGRSKDTVLAARYRRLAARRGKKRAAVAVAHSILVIAYALLRDGSTYVEKGATFYDQRQAASLQKHLVQRLERLGFQVSLTATQAA